MYGKYVYLIAASAWMFCVMCDGITLWRFYNFKKDREVELNDGEKVVPDSNRIVWICNQCHNELAYGETR